VLQVERLRGLSSRDPLEFQLSKDRSLEDIFVMKLIASRQGCQRLRRLFSAVLDFDPVYREIEAQYCKAGEVEQKIWIAYCLRRGRNGEA